MAKNKPIKPVRPVKPVKPAKPAKPATIERSIKSTDVETRRMAVEGRRPITKKKGKPVEEEPEGDD